MDRSKKEQINSQNNIPNQNKQKNHIITILLIIGILTIVGIIIVPKILETIEENSKSKKSNKITETIEVKVLPSYNEEAYVIEGIPDTIEVELTGKKKAVARAKENSEKEIYLDLSDYEPSKDKIRVEINYQCPEKVKCVVKPSSIKISIREKVSTVKPVKYKIIENELLEHFNIKSVELSKSEVIVKGSQDTLDSIEEVNALIDINDLVDKELGNILQMGTHYIDNIKLVAYDKKGKEVKNVDIIPSTIEAKVEIVSTTKEVPLDLRIVGELVTGRAISSIKINGIDFKLFKTEINGNGNDLENINSLPLVIDLDGAGQADSKSLKVKLTKPVEVKKIKDEEITIEIRFAEATQKTIEIKNIQATNVPDGLLATINSPWESVVSVQVIGTSEVLNSLDLNSSIEAYVDLTGLTEAGHNVPIQLKINDARIKAIVNKNINITLSKK